jgi:hypothetical protein
MSETIEDLRKQNADLKRRNEKLEKENRWLRVDSTKRAFYSLNRVLNQQVDLLNDFEISENIQGKKAENAAFERMQSIWKGLADMQADLSRMRTDMKIDGEDVNDEEVLLPISPEMIAD